MDRAIREFHVSRFARDFYRFDESLFSLRGDVLFANFHAARRFARQMNEKRDVARFPERAVHASDLNAMGLIDEILHYIVALYREQRNPRLLEEAMAYLEREVGREAVEATLRRFAELFPPTPVYRGEVSLEAYLRGETEGMPHRLVLLEELMMLALENLNPAYAPYEELFSDRTLRRTTAYPQLITALRDFLATQPPFGPENEPLFEMLREPARHAPHSLQGQLDYIRTHWGALLGRYFYRLLSSLDFLTEEHKPRFTGPGPAQPPALGETEAEENYSPDSDWMPQLVLIAKNTYVWLDQLSRQYGRPITRLDEIPDEELARLARWGITGLWLIGVWERSRASKRIKQMMGNPDAVASAYSLYDYRIADDLGGEAAYERLKARAWQHGIRLATDMVPNHMGIDSRWVIEHPDWFISLPYSPFPSYTFDGPNLSDDPRAEIYLEDHYYTRSDAAVVFKHVDRRDGTVRYIYHGNDGTSMPWNDTAQLDYLKAEVRETVIRTILEVARRSPIIRFDAAMTLTRKHYQRLWYPEPGTGGDIPSRAEFGMTREEFDRRMPREFWREVVERVAAEAPDTLLLAEAFWLMEGYFVRTLGMHRVYNSAFMNMLRDEKNADYRRLMRETLAFDPRILKRYVNFMNNPDERTAVDQFGKGDKYFGVCTLLTTLPGLPMFGHGQIEGFAEKYGMEFRRAYRDEQPDPYLIERHERQIFPLLHRRALFAEVDHFRLYDFRTEGGVEENVFAYSNRRGEERALVLYHNRYAETAGWIDESVPFAVKQGEEKVLRRERLAQALDLPDDEHCFVRFRDLVSGLEYLRNCHELHERGLFAHLRAYQAQVFLDFRLVRDEAGRYARLAACLRGRGVPDVEEAMRELLLAPVRDPFRRLLEAEHLRPFAGGDPDALPTLEAAMRAFAEAVRREVEADWPETFDAVALAAAFRQDLAALLGMMEPLPLAHRALLVPWRALLRLARLPGPEDHAGVRARSWLDEWRLAPLLVESLHALEVEPREAEAAPLLLATLLQLPPRWWEAERPARRLLRHLFALEDFRRAVGVNRYRGVLWFNKERFEAVLAPIAVAASAEGAAAEVVEAQIAAIAEAAAQVGYRVEALLEAL